MARISRLPRYVSISVIRCMFWSMSRHCLCACQSGTKSLSFVFNTNQTIEKRFLMKCKFQILNFNLTFSDFTLCLGPNFQEKIHIRRALKKSKIEHICFTFSVPLGFEFLIQPPWMNWPNLFKFLPRDYSYG